MCCCRADFWVGTRKCRFRKMAGAGEVGDKAVDKAEGQG
jgi:hypothetical protein